MKHLKKITLIMLVCLVTGTCFARRIKLEGVKTPKRSLSIIPIVADLNDDSRTLTIQFLQGMGYAAVWVTNESGRVVSHDIVDTSSSDLTLSLPEEAGSYQLSIRPRVGSEYTGEFELY